MASACQLRSRVLNSLSIFPPHFSPPSNQLPILRIPLNQSRLCFAKSKSRNAGPIKIRAMSSGSGPVEKTIGENPVVVYSKTWCSYSAEVKYLFKKLGVEPFVVELDQLGAQGPPLQESLESLTGQRTVPNVFIGGKHIGGCSDTIELHQKGELEPLLSEAGAKVSKS